MGGPPVLLPLAFERAAGESNGQRATGPAEFFAGRGSAV